MKTNKYIEYEAVKYRRMRDGIITIAIASILIICALFCQACKASNPVVTPTNTTDTADTTDINVRTREIRVITEADSASIKALLRCDSAYNVVIDELAALQGERIKADANVKKEPDGGVLFTVDCKEDSLMQIIRAQDSIIKSIRSYKQVVYIPVDKPISDYYQFTSDGFWILLSALALIIGLKVAKAYLKVQSGGIL